MANEFITGERLVSHLKGIFGDGDVVKTGDFRRFLGVSPTTFCKMKKAGGLPRSFRIGPGVGEGGMLLVDVAAWIENGGCRAGGAPGIYDGNGAKSRGRGRPRKNPEPAAS